MRSLYTLGDLVLDVVARVENELAVDTDTPGQVISAPGGSAANLAVWSARLGVPTVFAGRVGDDLIGRALVDDLRRESVTPAVVHDPVHPTAVLVLFAQGNARHMMVPSGANHFLEPADLDEEQIRQAGWLHLTGYSYFWEATRRTAAHALAVARAAGVPVSLDPSSAGFIRRHGLAIPAGVQVLLPNQEEAAVLAGTDDPSLAALRLAEAVPLVAVKLGAAGALICQGRELTHVPPAALDGEVVDTTGAGDAWGAAFLAHLRRGLAPTAAAALANRLGARVVTHMGARPRVALPPDLLV